MAEDQQEMTGRDLRDDQIRDAEAHRGFVREMDRHLGKAYGTGGAVVIGAFFVLVAVAWATGWWGQALLWVPGLTAVVGVLYVVRRRIYARRDELRTRVDKYCEANEIEADVLHLHYESEQMYPFFLAIFEASSRSADRQRALES